MNWPPVLQTHHSETRK